LQLADFLDISPQKADFLPVNALNVAAGPDDLEVLAFFNALSRSGVQIDDVAVGEGVLFLFFFGANDFRSLSKLLIADIPGTEKAAFTSHASRLGRCRKDHLGGWGRLLSVRGKRRHEQASEREQQ